MQKNHAGAIKGLGIAAIVLSGLVILLCIILMGVIGFMGQYADSYMDSYYYSYDTSPFSHHEYDPYYGNGYYDYYYDDYYGAESLGAALAIANIFLVIGILCAIVTLVAGIIALRFHKTPEKLGLIFGWSIAGAIVGFCGGGIIPAALFIIIAVFAYKDKQMVANGTYLQSFAAPSPSPYGHTSPYAQTTQAVTTATTMAAPAAPVAPAQPPVPTAAPAPVAPSTVPTSPAPSPVPAAQPGTISMTLTPDAESAPLTAEPTSATTPSRTAPVVAASDEIIIIDSPDIPASAPTSLTEEGREIADDTSDTTAQEASKQDE